MKNARIVISFMFLITLLVLLMPDFAHAQKDTVICPLQGNCLLHGPA